ncbi:restriction endonuclease subunit S [Aeromonas rivipollensis]|uniref:restriction endonuclease subunit S n=1 Tax=Aeromonas rivipollensis TaxID=948519 RepID=UPI003D1DE890
MKWPIVKLENLVSITSGFAFKSNLFSEFEGVPLIRIRDVVRGETETFYTGEYSNEFIINNGDILIGMDGDFNRARWKGGRALLNQRVCKIKADESNLCDNYLYHFLPKALDSINEKTHAVTVKHLSVKGIRDITIPLPPLTEQKRIAAILDKADAISHKCQQAINLANDFLRSVFLDMFGDPVTNPKGWEITNIGSLCNVSSGSTPSRQRDDYYKGSIPWVKTTEVDGYTIMDTEEHISEEALQESSCRLNEIGSILIAMYGQGKTRGKVGLLGIKAATNQACAVLSPSQKINMHYLYGFLSLSYENLRRLGQGGGQPNLNAGIIKAFSVPLPPRNLQDEFATIYEKIKSLQKEKETAQQQKNILLSSLSKKVFSGQL